MRPDGVLSLPLQFHIGALHGIGVGGQLHGELAGLQEKLVVLPPLQAQLIDAPCHEIRRKIEYLALEHGHVRLEKLERALGVLARKLVCRHVERIGGVLLADWIDAGKLRRRLGAAAGRKRHDVGMDVAGDRVHEKVERLPGLRLPRFVDQVDEAVRPAVLRVAPDHVGDLHHLDLVRGAQCAPVGVLVERRPDAIVDKLAAHAVAHKPRKFAAQVAAELLDRLVAPAEVDVEVVAVAIPVPRIACKLRERSLRIGNGLQRRQKMLLEHIAEPVD